MIYMGEIDQEWSWVPELDTSETYKTQRWFKLEATASRERVAE